MEWQQIIGFYHLVRQGSFTRAAAASYRTQSALSQQVRKLEEEFQCRLVDRINKKTFTLTPAGERLYRFAASVIGERQSLADDIAAIRGLPRGRLRLAAPFTTLYHLFPGQFKSFVKSYPHVELTILDRPQGQAMDLLRGGEIDMAVALESLVPRGLDARRWKEVEAVLIVPDTHPLAERTTVTLTDIAQYPLILPPRGAEGGSRSLMEEQFERHGITYRVVMESSNVELSARYVEAGIGISFATIAKGLNPLQGRKIRFLSLAQYFRADHLCVVCRKGRGLPAYAEDFVSRILGSQRGAGDYGAPHHGMR